MSHNPLNLRLYKSAYKTKIPPGYKGILKITPREKKGRKEGEKKQQRVRKQRTRERLNMRKKLRGEK